MAWSPELIRKRMELMNKVEALEEAVAQLTKRVDELQVQLNMVHELALVGETVYHLQQPKA